MIFHIKNFLIRVRMQKLCPFYKFQRDFANKVKIHICKFPTSRPHITWETYFLLFFDISIILCSPSLESTRLRTRSPTSSVQERTLQQWYRHSASWYITARSEAWRRRGVGEICWRVTLLLLNCWCSWLTDTWAQQATCQLCNCTCC